MKELLETSLTKNLTTFYILSNPCLRSNLVKIVVEKFDHKKNTR